MNRKLLPILLTAFVIAAICSFLVYRMVGGRMAAADRSRTTRVVAAAGNIKLGTILKASDLTTIDIAGTLPQGSILKPETVKGRGVISDLYQGEPILENRLAAPGSGGGLAAAIHQGMRACAVRVDEVVGVSGFATPGMRVDVLISGTPPGQVNPNEGTKVKTLLQNIEVLSAGQDIQKDAEGKPKPVQVVNLLVSPEQAEILSLASNQARIQLVLRNPLDTNIAQVPGTAMGNLLGDKNDALPSKPKPVAAVRRAPSENYSIEVFNGSKRSEAKFASEGKQ